MNEERKGQIFAQIEEVRKRTDIVAALRKHMELLYAGNSVYVGKCPFCKDPDPPMFNVHKARQFFHCFGCSEKGDVFTFLTKLQNRQFGDVLEELTKEAEAGTSRPKLSLVP